MPVYLLIRFTIVNCVNLHTQHMIQKYIDQHIKGFRSIRSNYVGSVCTYVRIFSKYFRLQNSTVLYGKSARYYTGNLRGIIREICAVLYGKSVWYYTGNLHGIIREICAVLYGKSAWYYTENLHGIVREICRNLCSYPRKYVTEICKFQRICVSYPCHVLYIPHIHGTIHKKLNILRL